MPRKKLNGDRLLNSIVSDFEHQRPALTKKQADELEAALLEQSAQTRGAGLTALTLSGRKLIKTIAGRSVDQPAAVDKVRLAYGLRDYAERLRGFAVLMDSASTRISLAARWRDDYEDIADAARSNVQA
jgi:hypothetical protein